MFTLNQINDIYGRLGKQTTLAEYLNALKDIGVVRYDSFIIDGHSEYYGNNNQKVVSPQVHEKLDISNTSDKDSMLTHLRLHEQGKTNYFEMSKVLAASGIEKWTFDTINMTITYHGNDKCEILVEDIV